MWNYSNRDVPRLRTYEEALAHYNSVKPFNKGSSQAGLRPLGSRKKNTHQIKLGGNQEVNITAHYVGDLITFHPDGVITVPGIGRAYSSMLGLIGAVLGVGVHEFDGRARAYDVWGRDEEGNYAWGSFPLGSRGPNFEPRFEWVEVANEYDPTLTYKRLVCTNAPYDYRYLLNRKALKGIKDRYKPFLKFARGFLKMNPVLEMPNPAPSWARGRYTNNYHYLNNFSAFTVRLLREMDGRAQDTPLWIEAARAVNAITHAHRGSVPPILHGLIASDEPVYRIAAILLMQRRNMDILQTLYDMHPDEAYEKTTTFGEARKEVYSHVKALGAGERP